VIVSTHPLCRWALTLGCAAFTRRFRRSQLSDRRAPLFELGLSSERSYDRARPAATATDGSHGLWFPSAHEGSRSTSRERIRLATGRPQGLITLSAVSARDPAPALFRAGSALGIHPSERFPPTEYPVRFRPGAPTCRFPRQYLPPQAVGRPDTVRLLGFCLRKSLARRAP
jgi:hypothetical protein